jgi:hypothetical protein
MRKMMIAGEYLNPMKKRNLNPTNTPMTSNGEPSRPLLIGLSCLKLMKIFEP